MTNLFRYKNPYTVSKCNNYKVGDHDYDKLFFLNFNKKKILPPDKLYKRQISKVSCED